MYYLDRGNLPASLAGQLDVPTEPRKNAWINQYEGLSEAGLGSGLLVLLLGIVETHKINDLTDRRAPLSTRAKTANRRNRMGVGFRDK